MPDRIFISPHGEVFFIEFKSAKGKLSQLQKKVIKDIEHYNVEVFIVYGVEEGLMLLNLNLKSKDK